MQRHVMPPPPFNSDYLRIAEERGSTRSPLIDDLKLKAKAEGCGTCSCRLRPDEPGTRSATLNTAPLAEIIAVPVGSEAFNCSAPDTATWSFAHVATLRQTEPGSTRCCTARCAPCFA